MKLFVFLLGLAVLPLAYARADLQAGASAVDITPQKLPAIIAGMFLESQSSTITDRLYTRSLVLEAGGTAVALVVVDTCMMQRSLIDEAKAIASKATGIRTGHMLVSATHTHSAPAAMACLGTRQDTAYAKWLPAKIAEGIITAHQRLQPARIGWAVVNDWQHTHCRRWIRRPDKMIADPFGDISARANMHPGHESPDVTGPSGPVDPGLSVISVQTAAGKPMAFFANHSMHYFGAKAVSGDYYGAFAREIASLMKQPGSEGPEFVAAMTQGTSGDQQWMDYSRPRRAIGMDVFAAEVAARAMEAYAAIKHQDQVPIAMTEKLLKLSYRVPDAKRLAWARPIAAKSVDDLPKNKPEVYAKEALILQERQSTEVKLQALRIGDLAITALPNEVYAITGLKLKAQSPLPATINIELANGGEGYIPPPEQHALGGYTTWPARTAGLEVEAEPKMVATLLSGLEEITGRKRRELADPHGPYTKTILETAPKHFWRMNEIYGPANKGGSGALRNAVAHGPSLRAPAPTAYYLSGPGSGEDEVPTPSAFSGPEQINRAIHLTGQPVTVDLGKLVGDFSIALWFWNAMPTGAPAHSRATLVEAADQKLDITTTAGNPWHLALGPHTAAAPLLLKRWHFVTLARKGDAVTVYLDGGPVNDLKAVSKAVSVSVAKFGGGLEGKLDEIAVFDRELSAGEVGHLWAVSGMGAQRVRHDGAPKAQGGKAVTRKDAGPKAQAGKPMLREDGAQGGKAVTQEGGAAQLASQPLSPVDSLKKWHVREGYRVELAAAEPVVLDPVAFDWDDKGRLWVVEMADYPLGMDGNSKPGGRIVMLEDSDADGRYDKRRLIADGLNFPTGILTWRDGAIVTAAPDIWFIHPDGAKKALLTGFSTGNQQLRVNGLRWGMDGWVYCAAGAHHGNYNKDTRITSTLTGEKIALGSRDFRFRPDTGEFDPQSGPSQFGRARDDWGHWFGVQNSFPLWHYVLQDHYLRRNPQVIPPDPIHQLFPRNPPVYPVSSMEKRFHSFDQAGRFTSACGIEVYRDNQLFDDGKTHAFTCEPFHNVVQHHVLEDHRMTFKAVPDVAQKESAQRGSRSAAATFHHDFLASEDRWCRPVMVRTGPDGALWVADMYRYMIEHPQWLPKEGKDELLPHYREGDDKGRIYRVVRASDRAKTTGWAGAQPTLGSANGWMRDRAQMQLQWLNSTPALNEELTSITGNKDPKTMAQAAWTRLGLNKLDQRTCLGLLDHASPRVREQALQMAERLEWKGEDASALQKALLKLVSDADEKVHLQLACSLGSFPHPWAGDLIETLLDEAPAGTAHVGAALSSVLPHLERVCAGFPEGGEPENNGAIGELFRCALATANEKAMAALLSQTEARIHFAEMLAVLDQKGLSFAAFAKQVQSPAAQAGLAKAATFLTQAAEGVRKSTGRVPLPDLELLATDRGYRAELLPMLARFWKQSTSGQEPEMLKIITRLQPADGPDFLLAGLNVRTPAMRSAIIETLLSSDAWTTALLERVRSKAIEANAFDAAIRARLLKHPKPGVRELATTAFAHSASALRAEVLAKFKPALTLVGDAGRGKAAFATACASCHKLDGIGLELGPDLRSVAQHEPEKLFNSILDPSAIIEPGFMAYHCTLKNGEQLYGVIATETSHSITLKLPGNIARPILRSDVATLKSANISLMPDGLEAALTPQSLADVITYVKVPR